MSIKRMSHSVYGVVETNRMNRDNVESHCIVDKTDFPNGVENGTLVAVDKPNGKLKKTGSLIGMVLGSERIYDQYHAGLKNFVNKAGEAASVFYMEKGNTFTTNTICYDDTTYTSEEDLVSALKNVPGTPLYGKRDAASGVIQIVAESDEAPFTVVKYTTLPDGQPAVKFILSDVSKL